MAFARHRYWRPKRGSLHTRRANLCRVHTDDSQSSTIRMLLLLEEFEPTESRSLSSPTLAMMLSLPASYSMRPAGGSTLWLETLNVAQTCLWAATWDIPSPSYRYEASLMATGTILGHPDVLGACRITIELVTRCRSEPYAPLPQCRRQAEARRIPGCTSSINWLTSTAVYSSTDS